ncbi:ribokinase [Mesoaciditoga lauensis]|uniref:ribokinase n=1 Tax=Mesoaciditoga lauensis TaxID=1495039 RepID=UPI00055C3818|nr:ribokinase [Mesoaciditoga lauensis]
MSEIVVFGSYVMDLTCFSPKIPRVGETVFSNQFKMGPGGKGFNQAVAAQKAGARVKFMTKIGKGLFNNYVKESFRRFGLSTEYLLETEKFSTGVALIIVDVKNTHNIIAVSPEACDHMTANEVEEFNTIFNNSKLLLTQLESNLEATYKAIQIAHSKKMMIVLNAAPMRKIDSNILKLVDVIILNEIEASQMTGIDISNFEMNNIRKASKKLENLVSTVIITLGEKGIYCSKICKNLIPAIKVNSVDSTGAGDAFAGIFSAYIAKGFSLKNSIEHAIVGAALSTTKSGTAPSMPESEEIEKLYKLFFTRKK